MTKKRFELVYEDYDSFAIRDNDYYIQENKHYHTLKEIVELLNQLNKDSKKLNELHEENQRLKSLFQSERRELIEQNNNYRQSLSELAEENEQLKKEDELFFGKVFDILLKYQDLFNCEMADEVLEELGIELTRWFE